MKRGRWQKASSAITAGPLIFGAQHQLKLSEPLYAAHLLTDELKRRVPSIGRRPKVALELTPAELGFLLAYPRFADFRRELFRQGRVWQHKYYRFWHGVVHQLKDNYRLDPIDHAAHKAAQDAAFGNDPDAVNEHFQARSAHMGGVLLRDRNHAAGIFGLDQLRGIKLGRLTGLGRQLKRSLKARFLWFYRTGMPARLGVHRVNDLQEVHSSS